MTQSLPTEKLQKKLAALGLASRREIERWITAGRIQVNGRVAKLGDRIDKNAHILVDGKPISASKQTFFQEQVLLYHKPEDEICTRSDPKGRPTVFDRLPKSAAGRWVLVGRLDYKTSGLLLFTNNGELAHQLMHPRFHLKRVYAVRVFGEVTSTILSKLQKGVLLEDGEAQFEAIERIDGKNKNRLLSKLAAGSESGKKANHWYQVTISIGKNRIVRRLWESQGLRVNRLIRIQFGDITLPHSLKPGEYSYIHYGKKDNL